MLTTETPYSNIREVAGYFRVSVTTIRTWMRKGLIPESSYIKIGEVYRFRLDEVEASVTKAKKPKKREN